MAFTVSGRRHCPRFLTIIKFMTCYSYPVVCLPCDVVTFHSAFSTTKVLAVEYPFLGPSCSSLEALLRRLPVDDVPDSLEVLCLAVLVLEAVIHVSISALQHHKTSDKTY